MLLSTSMPDHYFWFVMPAASSPKRAPRHLQVPASYYCICPKLVPIESYANLHRMQTKQAEERRNHSWYSTCGAWARCDRQRCRFECRGKQSKIFHLIFCLVPGRLFEEQFQDIPAPHSNVIAQRVFGCKASRVAISTCQPRASPLLFDQSLLR